MKITGLFFIFFCNLCYSADWGECKLNSYFYDGSIEDIEVSFDRDNKLFIDDFLDKNNISHDGIHLTNMKDKWYNVN